MSPTALHTAPACDSDFNDVVTFLKLRLLLPAKPSAAQVDAARAIHALTYGLISWRFFVRVRTEGQVFLDEAASDALQILPQALAGYRKPTLLLMRGVLENTLRHIYFTDHPVEFERANRDKKWYVSAEQLFDYLKNHSLFEQTEQRFDAIGRARDLYSEISAGVHGGKVVNLSLHRALAHIRFTQDVLDQQLALLERVAAVCNFFLLTFHKHRMSRMPQPLQRMILMTLPVKARQVWRGLR